MFYFCFLLFKRDYQNHDKFSNLPKLKWITLCKHIIKDLKSNNKYVDIYLNKIAILMYTEKYCTKILVWVPKIEAHVQQDACDYFIRSSIIALDIPHEYINYHQKIMIYPKKKQELMTFEHNEETGNYNLVVINGSKLWSAYTPAKIETVTISLPQSYGEISNLQTILNPIFYTIETYRCVYLLYL